MISVCFENYVIYIVESKRAVLRGTFCYIRAMWLDAEKNIPVLTHSSVIQTFGPENKCYNGIVVFDSVLTIRILNFDMEY